MFIMKNMQIENDIKLDFSDVLIKPKRSTLKSTSDVDLFRSFITNSSQKSIKCLPIIASNMDTVGTISMHKQLSQAGIMTCLHKFYSIEKLIDFFNTDTKTDLVWYSMGITSQDVEKYKKIKSQVNIQNVCIDVANGNTEMFVNFVKKFRDDNPNTIIMAGNICTSEMTEQLILSGVDVAKVGIGGGGACSTRIQTGVGIPQLSAIIECADAAHGLKGMICGDGGCANPGDVSKAFGGGADFVMLGSMLAGHDECEAEIIEKNGSKYMKFYGMSSVEAMKKHYGGMAAHRSSEGRVTEIPYKGKVEDTMLDILGGIRSTLTYVGASKLKELHKRTTFVRVNNQYNKIYEKYSI